MTEQKKSEAIKTPRALGCFVFLKTPRPGLSGGEAKYSLMLLWPKTTDLKTIKEAIVETARAKWGPNAEEGFKTGRLKSPLRNGDKKFEEGGDETFKNSVFMNASSTTRPGIIDSDQNIIDPGEVYSGCYFHAALRFYAYDKNGNKGVGCGLQNLLLVHKGKRIDGRKSAESEFDGFVPDVRADDVGGSGLDDML
jgi:hypothetical protein